MDYFEEECQDIVPCDLNATTPDCQLTISKPSLNMPTYSRDFHILKKKCKIVAIFDQMQEKYIFLIETDEDNELELDSTRLDVTIAVAFETTYERLERRPVTMSGVRSRIVCINALRIDEVTEGVGDKRVIRIRLRLKRAPVQGIVLPVMACGNNIPGNQSTGQIQMDSVRLERSITTPSTSGGEVSRERNIEMTSSDEAERNDDLEQAQFPASTVQPASTVSPSLSKYLNRWFRFLH